MARVSKTGNKPGTERYRDERRGDSKPKMHGKQWHELKPNPVEGTQGSKFGRVTKGPVGVGETEGFGKSKRGTTGSKRKRMTPVSKGRKGARSAARK